MLMDCVIYNPFSLHSDLHRGISYMFSLGFGCSVLCMQVKLAIKISIQKYGFLIKATL